MSSYLRNLPHRVRKYERARTVQRVSTGPDPVDTFGPKTETDEELGQLSDVEKDFALRRMPVEVGK